MAQAVQNVVLTISSDSKDFEKRLIDAFAAMTDAEQKAIMAFDKVNQKVAAQSKEVEKLIARENDLKAARVRAQDPKLVESINKELAKTQAALKGMSNVALFDDSKIRQTLTELSAVQNKAAEIRAGLNKPQATRIDATQRAQVDLDLSEAISDIEKLKSELKGVDAGQLENSIRGSLSEFSQLNDETRAFALNITRASDSGKQLADELQAIDRIAKGAVGSAKSLGDAIEDAQKPMQGLRNIGEAVRNTFIGAFAVEVFQNFSQGLNQLVVDFQKLDSQVQLLFDRTAEKSIDATSRIQALAETTDESTENILRGVNALAQTFELPIEKALSLVEQGFAQGANASQEFLDVLREYPEDFKRAGLSAEQLIKLTTLQSTKGIFSDRLADSVREVDIRINEARSGTGQLLNAVKLLGTGFEKTFKDKLKDPTFETIEAVKVLFDEVKRQNKDINKGEFLALAFGIGGEESKRAINLIADFEKETVKINQTFVATLEATKQAKQAQNEFAASIAPVVTQFKLLAIEGQGFIFGVAREFIEFAKESPELLTAVAGAVALNTFNVTTLAQRTIALATAQSAATVTTGLFTRAQQALNNAIRTNPLGLLLSAVGFLAVGFKELYDRNETFRKSVDALGAGISKAFAPVVAFIGRVINAFGEFAEKARLTERISAILTATINNAVTVFSIVGNIIIGAGRAIGVFADFIGKGIEKLGLFKTEIAAVRVFFENIGELATKLPAVLAGALNVLVAFATQSGTILGFVAKSVKEAFTALTSGDLFNFDRARNELLAAISGVKNFGSGLAKAFNDGYDDYLKENPLVIDINAPKEDELAQKVLDAVGPNSPAQKALDDNPLEIQARITLAGGEETAAGLQKQFEAERAALIKSEYFKRLIREGKKKEADAVLFDLEKSFLEKVLKLNIDNQTKINDARAKSLDAAQRNEEIALLERLKAGQITQFQFTQAEIEIRNKFNAQRLSNEFDAIRALDKINVDAAEKEKEAARLKFKDEKALNIQLEKIDKDLAEKRLAITTAFNEKAAANTRERTQTDIDEAKRLEELRLSVNQEGFDARQKFLNETTERSKKAILKAFDLLDELMKGKETKAARERIAIIQEGYNKQIELINDATGTAESIVSKSAININEITAEASNKRVQAVVESYQRQISEIDKIEKDEIEKAKGNQDIITAAQKKAVNERVNAKTDAAKKLKAIDDEGIKGDEIRVNLQGNIFERLAKLSRKSVESTKTDEEKKQELIELTFDLAVQTAQNTAQLIGQLLENQDAAVQRLLDGQIKASEEAIAARQKELDFLNGAEDKARGEDKRRIKEKQRDIDAQITLEQNKIKALEEQKKKADEQAAKRKKVIALAEVAISTAAGIVEAVRSYSSLGLAGKPLLATAIGLIVATGAAQAAIIAATPLAKGTLSVEGGESGKDSVHALLMPGEAVIPTKQAQKYRPVLEAVMKDKIRLNPILDYDALRPVRAEINQEAVSQTLRSPGAADVDMDGFLEKLEKALSKQKIANFVLDKRGFSASLVSEHNETQILDKKYSTR